MAFHVSSERVDRNVRKLARLTGKTITETIDSAVTDKLRLMEPRKPDPNYISDLKRMAEDMRCHLRPGLQSADDLELFDENGLFR